MEPGWPEVPEGASAQRIRSTLRDDVGDPARGLPELRLVPRRLDLYFLHEVEGQAVAERAEHNRVRTERAVPSVADVDPVHQIEVLEPAAAREGRVGLAGAAAARDPRRDKERVAEPPAGRDSLEQFAVKRRPGRGRGEVDDRRRGCDLHRLGCAPDLQRQCQLDGLSEAESHVAALHRLEPLQLHTHGVASARCEKRKCERSLRVRDHDALPLRTTHGHRGTRDRQPLTVEHATGDRAGCPTLCRGQRAPARQTRDQYHRCTQYS